MFETPRILLVTDLDKTLLDDDVKVPEECLSAISKWTEQGGLFTVATGRPTRGALLHTRLMDLVTLPIISYNGACIYDVNARQTIQQNLLPDQAVALLQDVLIQFPAVGALVFCGEADDTFAIRENVYTTEVCWVREHYRPLPRSIEDIPLPWNKIVLAGPPQEMAACKDYVHRHAADALTIILSEEVFLEVVAVNTDKSLALRTLAESEGIAMEDIIAVGDSLNDLKMLTSVGMGVAVSNAENAVKAVASHIVASNTNFGVRECIQHLALPKLRSARGRTIGGI